MAESGEHFTFKKVESKQSSGGSSKDRGGTPDEKEQQADIESANEKEQQEDIEQANEKGQAEDIEQANEKAQPEDIGQVDEQKRDESESPKCCKSEKEKFSFLWSLFPHNQGNVHALLSVVAPMKVF